MVISFDHRASLLSPATVVSKPRHVVSLSELALGVLSPINNTTDLCNSGVPADVRFFNGKVGLGAF
jgi:hypothetical protein